MHTFICIKHTVHIYTHTDRHAHNFYMHALIFTYISTFHRNDTKLFVQLYRK